MAARFMPLQGLDRSRASAEPMQSTRQRTKGPRLNEHVAEGGRLDRPGDDRHAACVRGQLAEHLVAGSATDDVHDVDLTVGQPLGASRTCDGYASARLTATDARRTPWTRSTAHVSMPMRSSRPASRPAACSPSTMPLMRFTHYDVRS